MIANLPLLFANGNPTSLSGISAPELERFITFMVTCSWGHDTVRHISRPPWWPDNVPFAHPFARPRSVPPDWSARLKALVKRCYDFHKSAFLLVFSAQLARYPRARLRYVDNRDHTTSLYYRPSGRLLVTFRNENMHYDRKPPAPAPPTRAIYLCDSCDSHFSGEATLRAHERLCNAAPAPVPVSAPSLPDFLAALRLQPLGQAPAAPPPGKPETKTRNGRSAASERGPSYPFSSLAYLKKARWSGPRDLSYSRERAERYCSTSVPLAKLLERTRAKFPTRYRTTIDYWERRHTFPGQRGKRVLSFAAQLLLLRCRPVCVRLARLPPREPSLSPASLSPAPLEIADSPVPGPSLVGPARSPIPGPAPKEPLKLAELPEPSESAELVELDAPEPASVELDPLREEVIDLCSDDEERVSCVVRGGAVLRRTGRPAPPGPGAATGPGAANGPGTPGGPAVLRRAGPASHRLLLITRPLQQVTSLQTISID